MIAPNQCPVCHARFRGTRVCSRCGVDLGPLMRLVAQAWLLRQAARQALERGDAPRARALACEAQRLHRTPRGSSLRLLSGWLAADAASGVADPPSPDAVIDQDR